MTFRAFEAPLDELFVPSISGFLDRLQRSPLPEKER